MSGSSCTNNYDICVIRGDTFDMDVGLTSSYQEVLDNPTDWEARMVFREYQDDDVTPYLTLIAQTEVNPDPLYDEPPIYYRFNATTTQTQSLPDWDHVYYVELVQIGPAVSPIVTRLFQGSVDTHD